MASLKEIFAREPEANAAQLEQQMITRPPTADIEVVRGTTPPTPAADFEGDPATIPGGGPGFKQGIGTEGFEPVPKLPDIEQEGAGKLASVLERIEFWLREHERPDLYTNAFRVSSGASPAWSGQLIPSQPGAAIYVCAVWGFSSAAVSAAFGQGNSSSDAEFFPSNVDAGSDLGLLSNKAFTLVNSFPDWVFRCDPGKSLLLHTNGTVVVDGYIQYFARPIAEQKYR